MLSRLHIQGLAIVESVTVEISGAFNVITGETGAGKSILIRALSLLLGHKAQAEDLRDGCDKAVVVGEFVIPKGHPTQRLLEDLGIEPIPDSSGLFDLIIRRSVARRGRSQAWVNDVPVAISSLKKLGYSLVDICGQFENQKILNPREHVGYLDQFLDEPTVLSEFARSYQLVQKVIQDLISQGQEYLTKVRDQDYWNYRFQEIEAFGPSREEYIELDGAEQKFESQIREQKLVSLVQSLIDESAGGDPLSRMVWKAFQELDSVAAEGDLGSIREGLGQCAQGLDDLSFKLGQIAQKYDGHSAQLEEVAARLEEYRSLFAKCQVKSVDEFMDEVERIQNEVSYYEKAQADLLSLYKTLQKQTATLFSHAKKLDLLRLRSGKKVAQKINQELTQLSMTGASIRVEYLTYSYKPENLIEVLSKVLPPEDLEGAQALSDQIGSVGKNGLRAPHFTFSSNKGESFKPLHAVASGGEISRIILALKRTIAVGSDTCLLVFDEIDTGVSGRVADLVGRKLKGLGEKFQVLCVSHLPQVAAYAERHYVVEKKHSRNRVETNIRLLSKKSRAEEIARMLSGEDITKESLKNAQSLVQKAQKTKDLANNPL